MLWMWIKKGIVITVEVLNILLDTIEIREWLDKGDRLATRTMIVNFKKDKSLIVLD